jgi:Uma2 family endonuclease
MADQTTTETVHRHVLTVPYEVPVPNVDDIVTEDDTPVDNWFSEKQQRLLTEPLYSSWPGPAVEAEGGTKRRLFLAAANVGLFAAVREPPVVPDMFLSLDVQVHKAWHLKEHRSYFFWEFGKAPEMVIEVVSNREGHELGSKLEDYARMRIFYYAVFDPFYQLGGELLQVFEWRHGKYEPQAEWVFPILGLGLTLWEGAYEGRHERWLRWCDAEGGLIPTGTERAEREAERAEREAERADRLAARLRELGIDPDVER